MNKIITLAILPLLLSATISKHYKAGQCYEELGDFERWEKPTVIKILEVGVRKYHYSLINFKENRAFSASDSFSVIEAIYPKLVVCPK